MMRHPAIAALGALAPLLAGALPAQETRSPALEALGRARTRYFKELVDLTGGRLFVLPPEEKEGEAWRARVRGIRCAFRDRLREIIAAHPGDPGLARVRLCAARELFLGHRPLAAAELAARLDPAGLDPEGRLAGGRLLAALGRGRRAAALCAGIEAGELPGSRHRLALAGILAAGGRREEADRIVAHHLARAGGAEAFGEALAGMEILAAGLHPGVERPLLARACALWAARFPGDGAARAAAARVPGLELGRGDRPPDLAGPALAGGELALRGKGPALLLFWQRGGSDGAALARFQELARKYGGKKLAALGVCLDREPAEARRWLEKRGLPPGRHLAAPGGLEAPPARAWGITRTPFFLVLDDQGRIADLAPRGRALADLLARRIPGTPPPADKDEAQPAETER